MKLQNSIIASALVSFVCAAPFTEGSEDKAIVSNNSAHLESESTNFDDVIFVPRSVIRKREVGAGNEAAKAVSDLFDKLATAYFINDHWETKESDLANFVKEFERARELAKAAPGGAFERDLGYIREIIKVNKAIADMTDKFEGCDYAGADLVITSLYLELYALTTKKTQGKVRADRIAEAERSLQHSQLDREAQEMVPGLQKVFVKQVEKVKEIISDLKEYTRSDEEAISGSDGKKTCPEIV